MKLLSKKFLHILLTLVMVVAAVGSYPERASAAYTNSKERGDELYSVTFTYDPSTYQGDGPVSAVGFFGSFVFYPSNLTGHTDATGMMDNTAVYTPDDYEPGMALLASNYFEEMTYDDSTKLYTLELQLPAGSYIYQYVINPVLGDTSTENPMSNVLTKEGTFSITSGTYVADPDLEYYFDTPVALQLVPTCYVGSGDEAPQNPISDEAKRGKVSFESYTDVNGNAQYLGIYLPADYDDNAIEPYKVIFASHGYGGDETHWFTLLGINNIMDNLIAEGKTEEAIVITMNNTAYNWDFNTIKNNVLDYIIPFVEENYNVSTEPKDRAFCGLSMGSMTTLHMYMNATTSFGYFGAFSGGYQKGDGFDLSKEEFMDVSLMIGCGEEDFAYNNEFIGIPPFMKELEEAGLSYTPYFVTGAHDMFTWPQMYTYFVESILWTESVVNKEEDQDPGANLDTNTTNQEDSNIGNGDAIYQDTDEDGALDNGVIDIVNEVPKTGDNSEITVFVLFGLMLTCLFVFFKGRKKLYR